MRYPLPLSAVLGLLMSVSLTGCLLLPRAVHPPASLDNVTFMELWQMYRECEQGESAPRMAEMAVRLRQMAGREANAIPAPNWPPMLARHVEELPSRLAVDPAAMAAACSLYTGQAALLAGSLELATELFEAVLRFPESKYLYYVTNARLGLSKVDQARAVGARPDPVFAAQSPL